MLILSKYICGRTKFFSSVVYSVALHYSLTTPAFLLVEQPENISAGSLSASYFETPVGTLCPPWAQYHPYQREILILTSPVYTYVCVIFSLLIVSNESCSAHFILVIYTLEEGHLI